MVVRFYLSSPLFPLHIFTLLSPTPHLPQEHAVSSTVVLDETALGGGGQIFRIGICLAVIVQIPLQLTCIHGNLPRGGGLKPQYSTGDN